MLSRKEREVAIRKNEMIEAAEQLFSEFGYENVTMDDIAKKAEFGRRTLYLYFNKKEDLYLSVFNKYQRIKLEITLKGLDEEIGVFNKLNKWGHNYYEFYNRYPWFINYQLLMDFYDMKDRNYSDNLVKEYLEINEETLNFIRNILLQGIEEGSIRNDLCADQLLTYLCFTLRVIAFRCIMDSKNTTVLISEDCNPKKFFFDYLNLLINSFKKSSQNL